MQNYLTIELIKQKAHNENTHPKEYFTNRSIGINYNSAGSNG